LPAEESPCANGTPPSNMTDPQCNPITPGVAVLRWSPDGVQLSSGLGGRRPSAEVAALHRIGWQESPEYALFSPTAYVECVESLLRKLF
jgi:hypothetical protein